MSAEHKAAGASPAATKRGCGRPPKPTAPPDAAPLTPADLTSPESKVKQRAVTRRVQACCDIFSSRLTLLPKGTRFHLREGREEDARDRVRNSMRVFALGCVASLGRELGLISVELYGKGKGRTLIPELADLHNASVQHAIETFEALRRDKGEVGVAVAQRFALLVDEAKAEVEDGLAGIKTRRRAA